MTSPENPIKFKSKDYVGPLLLVCVGTLFLLQNFGVLPHEIWFQISRFWPVILIMIGVQLVIGNRRGSGIFMTLATVLVFGAIVTYAAIHTSGPTSRSRLKFLKPPAPKASATQSLTDRVSSSEFDLESLEKVRLQLDIGSAQVKVEDSDILDLLKVNSVLTHNKKIVVDKEVKDKQLNLATELEGWTWGSFDTESQINVVLDTISNPIDIDLDIGAGKGEVVLKQINVENLNIDLGVGSTLVDISQIATPSASIKIDVGIGSSVIKVPAGTPLVINYSVGIGSVVVNGDTINSGLGNQGSYKSFESEEQEPSLTFEVNVGTGKVEIISGN